VTVVWVWQPPTCLSNVLSAMSEKVPARQGRFVIHKCLIRLPCEQHGTVCHICE
jgi:hypothetical protein